MVLHREVTSLAADSWEDRTPSLLVGPDARRGLLRGVDMMVRLLRPTLGPLARTVLVDPIVGQNPPEVLSSAATIARRLYGLDDRSADIGAMLIRHISWQVYRERGDGSALAAVVAGELLRAADRAIVAGASPIAIREGIERAIAIAHASLRCQARPVTDPHVVAKLVAGTLQDPSLADLVAEITDSVGAETGAILIEDSSRSETTSEYLEGVRWDTGWLSSSFQARDGSSLRLNDPRILLSDMAIQRPEHLVPTLEACLASGTRSLLVIAPEMSDAAISFLLLNRDRGVLEGAVAVRAPSQGVVRSQILDDLAVLTGGRCLRPETGARFADVTAADLGRAQLVWARRSQFGMLGGHGEMAAIRARLAEAKAELRAVGDDDWLRAKTAERIAKLAGTAAVILVGAPTASARAELKGRIESAVSTARAAIRDGVVAGGGAAFVDSALRIEQTAGDDRSEEATGMRALAHALLEPMAAIAANAGYESGPILAEARRRGPAWTFDAVRGTWVDPWAAGILDALSVLEAALDIGARGAASALTVGAVVHRRHPEEATEP